MIRIPIRIFAAALWTVAPASAVAQSDLSSGALGTRSAGMATVSVTDGNGGMIVAWGRGQYGFDAHFPFNTELFIQRLGDPDAQHPDVVRWAPGGVPLCTAPGFRDTVVLVSDGAGGAIAAWQDMRSGVPKIFAQRVNADGVPQWTHDGLALCTAEGEQWFPTIVSDGAGGAIVAWTDYRAGGETDIYAQRVDAGGALQWDENGVGVCMAAGYQIQPMLVSADSGGAIVVWFDDSLDPGIYAARIGAEGTLRWPVDGVPVFTTPGFGLTSAVTSDGAGGAYVAGSKAGEVLVQRVTPDGVPAWMPDGVVLGPGSFHPMGPYGPAIVRDVSGGAIVSWNGVAQRVDAAGIPQWTAGGVRVVGTSALGPDPMFAVSDGGDGAFLIWHGLLQHVTSSGSVMWTPAGLPLSPTWLQPRSPTWLDRSPSLVADGSGGAIVTWYDVGDRDGGIDLVGQAFDGAGIARWIAGGVPIATTGGRRRHPSAVSDGSGSVIVTWAEKRGLAYDILARKFGGLAQALWPIVTVCDQTGTQTKPLVTADGSGGIMIAWTDWRSGAADIYAQRIDAVTGGRSWDPGGVPICTSSVAKTPRAIIADDAGGSIVAWEQGLADENRALFVQRVNGSGALQWPPQGIHVGFANARTVAIAPDGTGGLIMVWMRTVLNLPTTELVAQRFDGAGAPAWGSDPLVLETFVSQNRYPSVLGDRSGGAFVSWDSDQFSGGVRVQHLDGAGNLTWGMEGVTVTPPDEVTGQALPQIVSDGAEGMIVVWTGTRPVHVGPDLFFARRNYAQRLDAAGAALWDSGGVALHDSVYCCFGSLTSGSSVVPDGEGGAIVAWRGHYTSDQGGNLYAQRIDSNGTPGWPSTGAAVSATTTARLLPSLVTDGAGGSYLYWQEARDGITDDVFGLRLTGVGTIPPGWTQDGVTSVLASLVGVVTEAGRVRVTWQLADAQARAITVQRSFGGDVWHMLGPASRTSGGRVEYEDRDVPAGRRIGYRLAIGPEEARVSGGEVWVDVPHPGLAIGAESNPAFDGRIVVRLSVPSSAPTVVEVLDVAGRRRTVRTLQGLVPGVHSVELESARRWSAGLYYIRVRHGSATAVTKFVVLR